jgi:hypothetical protein
MAITPKERAVLEAALATLAVDLADLTKRVGVLATTVSREGYGSSQEGAPAPPDG